MNFAAHYTHNAREINAGSPKRPTKARKSRSGTPRHGA